MVASLNFLLEATAVERVLKCPHQFGVVFSTNRKFCKEPMYDEYIE